MDFSPITNDLFIGSMPLVADYDHLRELGVQLIINMRFVLGPRPDPHHVPINTLWLRSIDSPIFPISIQKLMRGAQAALELPHPDLQHSLRTDVARVDALTKRWAMANETPLSAARNAFLTSSG